MKIDSLQPELSEAKKLARFKGFYCMAGLVAKLNQHGKPYWVITLMDAFTEFEVIATQIDCDIKHFSHFGFVHVEAKKIKTTPGISSGTTKGALRRACRIPTSVKSK